VVLSRTASVGFSGIMPQPMATTQDFVNWVCGRRITPDYLMWLFRAMKPEFDRLRIGSTHKTIYMPDVRQFRGPLPPLDEQRAIAAFLDSETTRVDALIQKKQRQIELLHEKRTALISHAVTKGLDPDVPMKDSGIDWLGEVPTHWHVCPLMFLTPPFRKIMYGIVLPGPHEEGGIPIVKAGNVAPGKLQRHLLKCTTPEIEAKYARARLRAGDLVFAIRGSIGAVEMVPDDVAGANITQDVARVAPRAGVDPTWLLYALKAGPVQAQAAARTLGATIRGLNIGDLKRLCLPVPPRQEQTRIAEHLNVATERIHALTARVQESIERLREYRTALISAAVTGKIDIRREVA